MDLIVIRHAIAKDREAWAAKGKEDAERPLTQTGVRKMRDAARGLTQVAPILDTIATSPLTRARQTARIVGKAYDLKPKRVKALSPDGDREKLLAWLRKQPDQDTIAIVGHEPSLGIVTSWLLASPLNHFIEFKKGGAAKLSWPGPPEPGTGWLHWLVTPGQLRRIAVDR